ncbi:MULTISPECIES: class I SAM-dependent methyltransferase [Gammaproteobacteria]|uniref:class I SAM-dependent methyltransferase n=1 Tax=Gammaproteobacteria TaxID=1236 RepID=UPI001ADB20D5|nr:MULTISPECIES: class I SAM-dependent methyltransferase [Gammaproteobacteria]MBO9480861.1 class I SAM-dependent methyltransferase [Salinisphaera sp. G21_0]MBO9495213.1 class I SAM-dependent methyltransferase [Thalassotalea sp. G20_0]
MPEPLYERNQLGVGFTFHNPVIYLDRWLGSWKDDKPLLDIGCGHGVNTHAALMHGAQVIATDMDKPDLSKWLKDLPETQQKAVTCKAAKLPENIPFADNAFCGILCAEVFHFLANEEVAPSINEIYRILEPGGTLLLTCCSCDVEVLKSTGLSREIRDGVRKSPLTVSGQRDYLNLLAQAAKVFNCPEITDPVLAAHKINIPGRDFCFFASEQLEVLMKHAGFVIEVCEQGEAPHYPVWSHGNQDQIRIIARKPA